MPKIDEVLANNLTPAQVAAACDDSREVLCLACAGSGKSRTLAFRIARLLANGAEPTSIVAFTFTDKAAESIKLNVSRALQVAGLSPAVLGALYIGTIHSYCRYVLGEMDARYRQFDVLDQNRLKLYLVSRYPSLGLHRLRSSRGGNVRYFELVKQVASAWAMLNDEMIDVNHVIAADDELGTVLAELRTSLEGDEFLDFSLMIRLVVDGLRENDPGAERAVRGLDHLMVDEYQDVNPLQETLIRELHNRSKTLFVVGDDDQAIYAWRGADVSNILDFRNRYPQSSEHTLSTNFRSTSPIVETADSFAAAELGASRYGKNPQAHETPDPRDYRVLWFDTRVEEAQWVADRIQALLATAYQERDRSTRGLTPADFAVLMRSTRMEEQDGNPRHLAFTRALEARGIPYSLEAGGSVFDRVQVEVLRDTFELLRDASPPRAQARAHFNTRVVSAFPNADFNAYAQVLTNWGRQIHLPRDGPRRRVYPQQLVHDLLEAFRLSDTSLDDGVMQDIGIFSRMMQDVETVYLSIDSPRRFAEILNFLQNVAQTGYDTSTADVLRRPDAVTVSTVHQMKGLEFPAVFVVDVEAQRFPKRRQSYNGWMPRNVVHAAVQRGAYQSTRDEEARLFYTAITRAERYLYVTGAANLPAGRRQGQQSAFVQRLSHHEISDAPAGLPVNLTQAAQSRRVDETIVPTSYSDIRYYLRCPKDYQLRKSFGFSPPVVDLFGYGLTVHAAICKLHELFPSSSPSGEDAEDVARDVFHLKHVPPSRDPSKKPGPYERARDSAADIARTYAESYRDDFAQRRQVEARFEIPVEQAVISGSIDLMLQEDEQGNILDAAVVDFKAMEGGEEVEQNEDLSWTELSLQVQLYAIAAREVLGENARTGSVHLLKDNQRVEIPVSDKAVRAAIANVEWAVDRIIAGDFPMRPHPEKCAACDFKALCPKRQQDFAADQAPPPIHIPFPPRKQMARAFEEFEEVRGG
ncbi:MAG TPA: ATP-dependent DNA helicase [Thermoguttaceae bacterium]|nr:ATP-dependent DNA helicase [Thermoguttaceae bacterium]